MVNLDSVKDIATEALLSAADRAKKGFFKDTIVHKQLKGYCDYRTSVDVAVEESVHKQLSKSFPEWGFLGEENIKERDKNKYLWILDPLCSTNNFVFGLPLFGCTLGLLKDGEVVLALIYLPVFDDLLYATKGGGTFLNNKSVHVSDRKRLKDSMILYDNQFHKTDKMISTLSKLSDKCFTIRITGSAAYDMFSIATGIAEGRIFHKTKFYDFLPASLLVEESGGRVTNFRGEKVSIYDYEVLVSNGAVHDELLKIIHGQNV